MSVLNGMQIMRLSSHLLVPEVAVDVLVLPRVADEPPLEEGDVDDGRVEVDALKDEHLEGQVVVEVGLRAVHL